MTEIRNLVIRRGAGAALKQMGYEDADRPSRGSGGGRSYSARRGDVPIGRIRAHLVYEETGRLLL